MSRKETTPRAGLDRVPIGVQSVSVGAPLNTRKVHCVHSSAQTILIACMKLQYYTGRGYSCTRYKHHEHIRRKMVWSKSLLGFIRQVSGEVSLNFVCFDHFSHEQLWIFFSWNNAVACCRGWLQKTYVTGSFKKVQRISGLSKPKILYWTYRQGMMLQATSHLSLLDFSAQCCPKHL